MRRKIFADLKISTSCIYYVYRFSVSQNVSMVIFLFTCLSMYLFQIFIGDTILFRDVSFSPRLVFIIFSLLLCINGVV